MRQALALVCALTLGGCAHMHIESSDKDGNASISVKDGNVHITSKDADGTKSSVDITGAQVEAKGDGGSISLDASAKDFKMKAEGKDGRFENNVTVAEADLGVPYYPGSKELKVGCMLAKSENETCWIEARTTTDTVEQVVGFYRPKLQDVHIEGFQDKENDKSEMKGKLSNGDEIGVTAERQAGQDTTSVTVVHVHRTK